MSDNTKMPRGIGYELQGESAVDSNWTMRVIAPRVVLLLAVAALALAAGFAALRLIGPDHVFSAADFEILGTEAQSAEELEPLGYRARPELSPWPISIPVDWAADPFLDDNWQFLFQGWGMTDPYIVRYFRNGDVGDLGKAAAVAADWARFHYEEHREAPYSWFDMAAGFRAMKVALFLDRIRTGELIVPDLTKARLRLVADDHARRLQDEAYIALNNHGLFQILGLRMLCELPETKDCKGAKRFAGRKLREIVELSYSEEGVHKEHSPGYALRVTAWLAQPSFLRWWPKLVGPVIDKARPLEPWYVVPNGEIVTAGDSDSRAERPFLDVPEQTCLPHGCFLLKDLTPSGYAIIRSLPDVSPENQSMLFVTGAAWSLVHKHVDDLSFILFEKGRYIFVDTGTPGYTRDARRRYALGASAHNTIGLADFHLEPKHVQVGKTRLDPIVISNAGFVIEGSVDRNTIFQQHRTLTYDPGRLLVVRDQLSGRYSRQYVSSLHLAPDLTPVVHDTGFSVDLGEGHRIEARIEEPDCVVSTARGQEDPLLGWIAVAGGLMPTSVVRAVCPGVARTITWQIDLSGSPPQ